MTTIDRNEINYLKRIDIRIFLSGLGWIPDPADRYKKVTFTKDGRTVKTWQKSSGEYLATDHGDGLTGDAKKGHVTTTFSVFDLAFEQVGDKRWKEACDLLRSIVGKPGPNHAKTSQTQPAPVVQTSPLPDHPQTKNKRTPEDIRAEYQAGSTRWHHGEPVPDYLVSRGITSLSKIFDGTFRVSDSGSGNLRFPHRYMNAESRLLTGGVEKRGPNTKGLYSVGGTNGLWQTVGWPDSGTLVVFESQINAMSYDIMHPHPDGQMMMSIRAGTEHIAVRLIKLYIHMKKISSVIVATDNDAAGLGYASRILAGLYVNNADREPGHAKYHGGSTAYYVAPPARHEDWNDALRASISEAGDPAPTF